MLFRFSSHTILLFVLCLLWLSWACLCTTFWDGSNMTCYHLNLRFPTNSIMPFHKKTSSHVMLMCTSLSCNLNHRYLSFVVFGFVCCYMCTTQMSIGHIIFACAWLWCGLPIYINKDTSTLSMSFYLKPIFLIENNIHMLVVFRWVTFYKHPFPYLWGSMNNSPSIFRSIKTTIGQSSNTSRMT